MSTTASPGPLRDGDGGTDEVFVSDSGPTSPGPDSSSISATAGSGTGTAEPDTGPGPAAADVAPHLDEDAGNTD